jgi:hypothetical protein
MHQSAKSSHDTLLSTGMTRFIAFEPSFCCTGQGEFLFAIFRGVCAGRPERSNGVLPVWEVAPERGKPCSQTLFFYPHFPSVEKKNRDLIKNNLGVNEVPLSQSMQKSPPGERGERGQLNGATALRKTDTHGKWDSPIPPAVRGAIDPLEPSDERHRQQISKMDWEKVFLGRRREKNGKVLWEPRKWTKTTQCDDDCDGVVRERRKPDGFTHYAFELSMTRLAISDPVPKNVVVISQADWKQVQVEMFKAIFGNGCGTGLVDEGTLKIGPYNDGKNDDEAHCVLSWPLPAQESMREEIRKAFKESLKKVLDSKNP